MAAWLYRVCSFLLASLRILNPEGDLYGILFLISKHSAFADIRSSIRLSNKAEPVTQCSLTRPPLTQLYLNYTLVFPNLYTIRGRVALAALHIDRDKSK